MHLFAEMGHEAAGGKRGRVGGIEMRPGADPPGALQHDDVAVVRMKVRAAEMVALGPFGIDHVKSGFAGIANDDGLLCPAGIDWTPWDLVRQFEDDRGGVEL